MADDSQDKSDKTEEPTHRRLEEALKKGQVVNSREVSNFLMLLAFSIVILILAPYTMGQIGVAFEKYITAPHDIEVSEENLVILSADVVRSYAIILLPIIMIAVAAALVASLSQHPPVFSTETIVPKLEKISPLRGIKRLFSLRSVSEFVKGLIKITMVGVIAYIVLWPLHDRVDAIIGIDMMGIMDFFHSIALKIMIGVLIFMMIVAVLDYIYQRHEYRKNLRMSRHDIREELRQTEGDPHVKAKLKQIRLERVRKRMMAEVPKADVVVTNPTHFSVALKYDEKTMGAPVVVAKGIDSIALKIREVARENKVPIVENPPLARSLYDAVELDEEVPYEFYQAVAELIGHVYRLKNKRAA